MQQHMILPAHGDLLRMAEAMAVRDHTAAQQRMARVLPAMVDKGVIWRPSLYRRTQFITSLVQA